MDLNRQNASHGAIPVGKKKSAPSQNTPYNAQAPAPALDWGTLAGPTLDGSVLVAQSSALEGIAWVPPGSASLPSGAQNLVLATPSGSSGATSLRTLVAADIPSLPASQITSGVFGTAQGGTGLSSIGTAGQALIVNAGGTALTYATPTGGGGIGAPGGLNGQIQFNSNGSLGGVTVIGDGTLNTSTGSLTVTQTSGVSFAASATTDTTNANNIGSGTLGVARGGTGLGTLPAHAVMIGEGTANVSFATVGTGGRVLLDQGASSDPAFITVSGDGQINQSGALTVTKTSGVAFSASATTDATNASNINSGTLGVARGGTALSTIGTGSQVLGVNVGASALEYKTLTAGSNVTITPSAGSITIGAATANLTSTYITQTVDGSLTNAQALSSLATGVLKSTTTTGVLSIATGADLPLFTASGAGHHSGAVPDAGATAGTTRFFREDATWAAPSGSGTVTSVSWTGDGVIFTASADTPVTGSGTLVPSGLIAQTANTVLAGPASAGPTAPTFRVLGVSDLPTITPPAGGTGLTTLPAHAVMIGEGTSAVGFATVGTANRILTDQGASADPSFTTLASLLDATMGSTSGNVLVRGSSWSALAPGTAGFVLSSQGSGLPPQWTAVAGTGSVTSVSWTGDGTIFTASADTPVTSAGTLTPSGLIAQAAHAVLVGPTTAGPTAPTFRVLAAADIPNLPASQITSGILGVAQGGTAAATLTTNAVILGKGTAAVGFAATGTAGRHLVDQGAGVDPAFVAISGDATCSAAGALTVTKTSGVAFSASATIDTTNANNINAGTIGVPRGGTGLTTLPAHAVILGEGTSSPGFATVGTGGRHLVDQGAGADPAFVAISGDATCTSTGAMTVTKTSGVVFASSATIDATQAGNISGGTLSTARLPVTGLTQTQWINPITTVTGSSTLNFATSNAYLVNLVASAVTTITLSGLAVGQRVKVTTVQQSTVGTITWAGQPVTWIGGTAGAANATANFVDEFIFECPKTGTILGYAPTAPITGAGTGTVTSVGLTVPGLLFTVSGSPVTTSGTLALSTLTQTANTVLAGPTTGAAAVPTLRALVSADIPTLTSANITAPGSTGKLIYNSANVLTGASSIGVGASGQLQATAISAPSAAIGNLWLDSTRGTFGIIGGNSAPGLMQSLGGIVWQAVPAGNTAFTAATNSNATSLFSLLQAGSTIGSLTIPANSLTLGKIVRFMFHGTMAIPAAPPTLTIQLMLGGNIIWGVSNVNPVQTTTASLWQVGSQGWPCVQFQSVGATGKISGMVQCVIASGATIIGFGTGLSSSLSLLTAPYVASSALSVDTTTNLTFDVQMKFNTAVAGSSMQLLGGYMEISG